MVLQTLGKRVQRYMAKRTKRSRYQTTTVPRPFLKSETKCNTVLVNNIYAFAPNEVYALLNSIDRGTSGSQRVGNRITLRGITGNFEVIPQFTTGISHPVTCRVIIVYDKHARGVAPTLPDLFDVGGGIGAGMPYNINNLGQRFVFLYDKLFWKGVVTTTLTGSTPGNNQDGSSLGYRYLRLNKKFNLPVQFKDTSGGGVTDIESGSLYVWMWSSQGDLQMTLNGLVQTRYTDE